MFGNFASFRFFLIRHVWMIFFTTSLISRFTWWETQKCTNLLANQFTNHNIQWDFVNVLLDIFLVYESLKPSWTEATNFVIFTWRWWCNCIAILQNWNRVSKLAADNSSSTALFSHKNISLLAFTSAKVDSSFVAKVVIKQVTRVAG